MSNTSKTHRYGGIHGLCIFVKEHIAVNCSIIHDLVSELILWIFVIKIISGYDFIRDAVYLPHEMSNHYHDDISEYLIDVIITIRATYNVPFIILGDCISRTSNCYDFEQDFIYDGSLIENDQFTMFIEKII